MSQCSQGSTIPYTLSQASDSDFIQELQCVERLYFQPSNSPIEIHQESLLDTRSSDSEVDSSGSELNSDGDEEVSVPIEPSASDHRESISVDRFINETCGCKIYERPCCQVVDLEQVTALRGTCLEMTKEELDLTVKAELFGHRKAVGAEALCKNKKGESNTIRRRATQEYFFRGTKICRETFCFAHCLSRNTLQAIACSLDKDGLKPRVHGNTKRQPHNSLTIEDKDQIKCFIHKYASVHALPLPGRLPHFPSNTVLLLPSDRSMSDVHQFHSASAMESGLRSVSLRSFQRIWSELCPYITIARPKTDLCHKCQLLSTKVINSGDLEENEKQLILTAYTEHVQLAKSARDYYKRQTEESKVQFDVTDLVEGSEPNSCDVSFHYSWDFAQNVHYPHHPQQVGPIFFRSPRKCHVFGMCAEGSGNQVFYLIDEAECVGKGADSVASMAHHYFHFYGVGEKHGQVHFDNACGQNKNNTILWYALWRVLTGLHTTLELSTMIVGHTKFSPDWHFGLWKIKWRHSTAETMQDVARTVTCSSKSSHNVPQLISDATKPVKFFSWRTFLAMFFKPLTNLTKYHHYFVSAEEPGVITCKENEMSVEKKFNLLKCPAGDVQGFPFEVIPPGLDSARQWYLHDSIREFVRGEDAKDIACPKPSCPKVCTSTKKAS